MLPEEVMKGMPAQQIPAPQADEAPAAVPQAAVQDGVKGDTEEKAAPEKETERAVEPSFGGDLTFGWPAPPVFEDDNPFDASKPELKIPEGGNPYAKESQEVFSKTELVLPDATPVYEDLPHEEIKPELNIPDPVEGYTQEPHAPAVPDLRIPEQGNPYMTGPSEQIKPELNIPQDGNPYMTDGEGAAEPSLKLPDEFRPFGDMSQPVKTELTLPEEAPAAAEAPADADAPEAPQPQEAPASEDENAAPARTPEGPAEEDKPVTEPQPGTDQIQEEPAAEEQPAPAPQTPGEPAKEEQPAPQPQPAAAPQQTVVHINATEAQLASGAPVVISDPRLPSGIQVRLNSQMKDGMQFLLRLPGEAAGAASVIAVLHVIPAAAQPAPAQTAWQPVSGATSAQAPQRAVPQSGTPRQDPYAFRDDSAPAQPLYSPPRAVNTARPGAAGAPANAVPLSVTDPITVPCSMQLCAESELNKFKFGGAYEDANIDVYADRLIIYKKNKVVGALFGAIGSAVEGKGRQGETVMKTQITEYHNQADMNGRRIGIRIHLNDGRVLLVNPSRSGRDASYAALDSFLF